MKVTGNPSQGLWGATLGFFVGFAAVSLFGPTAHQLNSIMQVEPIWLGLLVAAPALSGSLLRIPFAAWVDLNGGRKPFLILLSLSVIGMIGLALTIQFIHPQHMTQNLFPLLILLGILCGCGIATFSVGISQVAYWFPQTKQGGALGTFAGLGNLAPGIISLLLPIVLSAWGLTFSYFIWLLFLIGGTCFYGWLGKNAPFFQLVKNGVPSAEAKDIARMQYGQELFPTNSFRESLVISASSWKTWILVLLYFTSFGGFIALTSWFPIYWKSFELSLIAAGGLTALFSLSASLIRVQGGLLADRIGGEKTAVMAFLSLLLGAIILSTSHNLFVCVIGSIFMAVGMGVANAAVFKMLPQEVPQAVGGAAGWVGGLGAFGGFVIPPIMGWCAQAAGALGYSLGFTVFICLSVLSLGLMSVLIWTRRSKQQVASELIAVR